MTLASAVILGTVTALASGLLAAEIRRASAEARADAVRRDAVAVLVSVSEAQRSALAAMSRYSASVPSYFVTGMAGDELQTCALHLGAAETTTEQAIRLLRS